MKKFSLSIFSLCFLGINLLTAQNEVPLYGLWWDGNTEYLINIDPYTATHEIVAELEGVQAVALGSSTVIQGLQWYVFKGQTNNGFEIVTVDIQDSTIYSQVPASSYPSDFFTELEYDLQNFEIWGLQSNFTTDTVINIDTLWIDPLDTLAMDSIWIDTTFELVNSYNSLVSVDFNTGLVDLAYPIPNSEAIYVNSSTFNSNESHYIYLGQDTDYNTRLYTIDTEDGTVLHSPIADGYGNAELHYDNTLNNLYGLTRSSEGPSFDPFTGEVLDTLQLVQINQETAEKTIIAEYPGVYGIALGGTTYIDDSSQYVFSGVSNDDKRMYVTDVNTGTILSDAVFTENYVELQVDNYKFSQKLYANYLELDLKVFLEGSYNENGTLNNGLYSVIPTEQAYSVAPYNYNGTETLESLEGNEVDWVLIELRTGTPNESGEKGTETVATKAAILKTDGSIVGVDGNLLRFNDLPEASEFYICIRHRNHLDILSSSSIPTNGSVAYDFTTAAEQAFGNLQLKATEDGFFMMYAGDYNQDGTIQTTDFDLWFSNPALLNAYESFDGNLDGTVQVTDYDFWFYNKAKVGTVEISF